MGMPPRNYLHKSTQSASHSGAAVSRRHAAELHPFNTPRIIPLSSPNTDDSYDLFDQRWRWENHTYREFRRVTSGHGLFRTTRRRRYSTHPEFLLSTRGTRTLRVIQCR